MWVGKYQIPMPVILMGPRDRAGYGYMTWNPRIERMPVEELRRMQYRLLKSQVYRLYSFNRFYHDRMRAQDVHPDDIECLEDVRKLPFMFKQDLRDNYPTEMFTATPEEVVRYHVSSGTTGKPTLVGYTERDLEAWSESLARALTSCGIGRGDVVQVSYGSGLFTGESDHIFSTIGAKSSVSYNEGTPCRMARTRSSPRPVSTFF